MAELTGLVVGVISLGLQVVGGVSNYVDCIKGRKEELESIKKQADNMKDFLLTIQDFLPELKNSSPNSATMMERHVNACNAELSALHALLSELCHSNSSSSGIRSKISEQKKKMVFPFNKSHLTRLEDRLTKVNSALQTAANITTVRLLITQKNEMMREIENVVAPLLSQQTMRAQSTITCPPTTPNSVRLENSANRIPSAQRDLMETAMVFASKPSLLSTSIEAWMKYDTFSSKYGKMGQACICRRSCKTIKRESSWGGILFSSETSTTRRHLSDCLFSRADVEGEASRVTVDFGGLSSLFNTATFLSFCYTRGAGGRSISCGLTYSPTVNPQTAPVFRIIKLVLWLIMWYNNGKLDEMATVMVLQHCFDAIGHLYTTKRASPTDLSPERESILHGVAKIFDQIEISSDTMRGALIGDAMSLMITKLLAWGVPTDVYNRQGWTAFASAVFQKPRSPLKMHLIGLLAPDGVFVNDSRPSPDINAYRSPSVVREEWLPILWQWTMLVEGSGGGFLSLAAVTGDENRVRTIIQKHPKSLHERDLFGNTPLHYAIPHPSCVQAILETSGASLIDTPDMEGRSPIVWASSQGYVDSARILIASGCQLLMWNLFRCHESCREDIIMGFKQRRDELRSLAQKHFTTAEADSLGLYKGSVLDCNAFSVQALLQDKHVVVSSRLSIPRRDRDQSVYHVWARWLAWVRAEQKKCLFDMLEKLWALGFHDVDIFWQDSISVIKLAVDSIPGVRWLIEHGADYWTPINQRNGKVKPEEFYIEGYNASAAVIEHRRMLSPAHLICAGLGQRFLLTPSEFNQRQAAPLWLLERSFQVEVADTCSCACSTRGCTPLKAFLDAIQCGHRGASPRVLAAKSLKCSRGLRMAHGEQFSAAIIRYLTFDALSLTHTCHNIHWPEMRELFSPDEVDEIHSEEHALLTAFAGLLSEFEQIALEGSGGTILIESDPEEFWMRRWLPRITEVLDELNGSDLTKEETSAAEAIGVVWGPKLAPAPRRQQPPRMIEHTPEYVMGVLNQILYEY